MSVDEMIAAFVGALQFLVVLAAVLATVALVAFLAYWLWWGFLLTLVLLFDAGKYVGSRVRRIATRGRS